MGYFKYLFNYMEHYGILINAVRPFAMQVFVLTAIFSDIQFGRDRWMNVIIIQKGSWLEQTLLTLCDLEKEETKLT